MAQKALSQKIANIKIYHCGIINIETYKPKTNSWSVEVDTDFRRKINSCATILIDNELFIAGGYEKKAASKIFRSLNLITSEWIDLPPMNTGRCLPMLISLKGYLVAFGGDVNNEDPASCEIYNFSTRKWLDIEPPYKPTDINQLENEESHTRQLAGVNKILYILDFCNGNLQSYDASSNTWTLKEIEKVPIINFGFAAVEGFLYIFGGYNTVTRQALATVKRYNISNDSWCEMTSLPFACASLQAIVVEQKIIIGFYKDVLEYNLKTDKWKSLCPLKIDHTFEYSLGTCNITGYNKMY